MKRAFDGLAAFAGLILLSPVMLVVAIMVRRSSPGPALFAQQRVGQGEKPFICYKFRTMATGAPVAGSHEVPGSWVTPLGKKLRAWKLDEIPQLYNVLLGEMSLVGPRPCLPGQAEVIAARRKLDVFSVRPGITGPAQLFGIDMSTPDALAKADRGYIDTRTFWGDLRLIVATALGGGAGDAARY
ncbi:sugar transferase [Mesorhizobium sp. NBSH29]|uniref:sugar transferase n=1 Tax=Mesorhizobium sp. NBSH29 TaxID=2654249 RepID=UPI00189656B6|nr:sugar transferase [Mesorhizobium sp. NBSH29]QPC87057.1 sugar transferase [Mesorhizobium sp. NBSH29]